ncbi:polysaccharide pyruvyl transferase family protein [Rhodococcus sp. NPDC079359]|uniref:polysaccharide pyruvyl transferase family protein n=1 Tax=Rhodococcus sp. NPDC079359 TaxID=3154961 RepID=UPI00344FEB62
MSTGRTVGLLDPSLDSDNMGDSIIQDSVRAELNKMFPAVHIVRLPTQRFMTRSERAVARSCDLFIVGGTNILNGNLPFYMQWKLDPELLSILAGKTIPMGVGWWKYQKNTNKLSARVWQTLFLNEFISVRDGYTERKLASIGISSINTACPTMWALPEVVNVSARVKSSVVVTLTDYKRHVEADLALFKSLRQVYDKIYVWPQGEKDQTYIEKLRLDVTLGERDVRWFNQKLAHGEADYVGTRLHAGVRAHQLGAHSLIVAIDNRATEIASDTGLPVIPRDDWANLEEKISVRNPARLSLPHGEIKAWKTKLVGILDAR